MPSNVPHLITYNCYIINLNSIDVLLRRPLGCLSINDDMIKILIFTYNELTSLQF